MQRAPDTLDELIEPILTMVRERFPDSANLVDDFTRRYYAGCAVEDLSGRNTEDLYGAAMSQWNFVAERVVGQPKVRMYNPDVEQHGWVSTHTVIEIVTDDMPFLVDSVSMLLNARGTTIHMLIHPVMSIYRDANGRAQSEAGANGDVNTAVAEAIMHIEVDRETDRDVIAAIVVDIDNVLSEVRATVEDWRPMRDKLAQTLAELNASPPSVSEQEREETAAFLQWIDDDHFTFLGYREYVLAFPEGAETTALVDRGLRTVAGSGLGVLRDNGESKWSKGFADLPAELRSLATQPKLLTITKTNGRSRIHRAGFMDYLGIKRFDEQGNVVGERRFVGLYTSAAYNRVPRAIPLLREKVARIMALSGYSETSHAGKALQHTLDGFPRDELFQIPERELLDTVMGILHLQERQRIRLFVHRDQYRRFFSCLVFVPRDRFSTQTRRAMQAILEAALGADESSFNVQLSESMLARLHFVLPVSPHLEPDYDVAVVEGELRQTTRIWTDDLQEALLEHYGEERGVAAYRRYGEAFRADYREHYGARVAVHDVANMETLNESAGALAMSLYRPLEAPPNRLQFKLFHLGAPLSLSDVLPMLENMGLRVENERPSKIKRMDGPRVWLHDLEIVYPSDAGDLEQIKDNFQDAFARVWAGEVENDGFNRLVARANLAWREIVVLRAYCKYLRQAGMTFSQAYVEDTFANNPMVARLLVSLFRRRFAVEHDSNTGANVEQAVVDEILASLDAVSNLDEDRILRSFLGVIQATLRTNYFLRDTDGNFKSYVSFKLDPYKVPELPEPRPMFEVFVYSPRMEGVHLRGGPVARGGIRWSDRREDFRTEVLGLVKAQMVKNAVIVPVGSKGGFVCKAIGPNTSREAFAAEGIACYKTLMCGLLDLTDNLVAGEVVPPPAVRRHDADDPYLVVAADKGTASFSDIANGIAIDYGFWLGDAFASGGSVGYDHKGMGITARGAWESVKRHFRELGRDIQVSPFTVVGVGDMSGDVFGNGMLLSPHIQLVAAFNHMHIFLDPNPDAQRTFDERSRLFDMQRSTWDDFDKSLISKGGGIYSRTAKSITLSAEVRAMLDIDAASLTPNDLIRAMLSAPVDLLWNGGIGTYVRASHENDAQVGDRANDAVRVEARALRCKVVGEGGNLGFTQPARIEFARGGGRIYTDAIDNSAGVDCSDHEVNIKVLLNQVTAAGDMTAKQREVLLAQMTDSVASLVLKNNYLQTQALSAGLSQARPMLDVHARLMRSLERDGALDRAIEHLPNEEMLEQLKLAGAGLTAPELSVLLAYVKNGLFESLLKSDFTDDPMLQDVLRDYFPDVLVEKFADRFAHHQLWREIICTAVANDMVNRAGSSFLFRTREETGLPAEDITRAFIVAKTVFSMEDVWASIEALDNSVDASVQLSMILESRKLVERATRWLLRHREPGFALGPTIEFFTAGCIEFANGLEEIAPQAVIATMDARAEVLRAAGVPDELARKASVFSELHVALDIVELANAHSERIDVVASLFFALGAELELHWLREQVLLLERSDRWQTLARAALRDDLYNQHRDLVSDVLNSTAASSSPAERLGRWLESNSHTVMRCRQSVSDLRAQGRPDFTMLSVAMREFRRQYQVTPVRGDRRRAAPEASQTTPTTPDGHTEGAVKSARSPEVAV